MKIPEVLLKLNIIYFKITIIIFELSRYVSFLADSDLDKNPLICLSGVFF